MKAIGFSYHKTDCGYLKNGVSKIESYKMLLATSKQGEGLRNFGCCHYIGFAYLVNLQNFSFSLHRNWHTAQKRHNNYRAICFLDESK